MLDNKYNNKKKCVIWDLDNTIWDGVLLEDNNVELKKHIRSIIEGLDQRGILQSISSKNDYDISMEKLEEFGLKNYFLYPQINWGVKSDSIKNIMKYLNISIDSIAFIDDQIFEREEVTFSLPQVLCIDAKNSDKLLDYPEFNPRFITDDSRLRRQLYLNDIKRNQDESNFDGAQEEFLARLNMKLTISVADDKDLKRIEELTVRTHQLNSTGYTYSYEELDQFRENENYKIYVAKLDDRYGTYGKIGVILIECSEYKWTIKLLLMSCRVMSRGVGTIMINFVKNIALEAGVELEADFVETGLNRTMYIAYRFAGFKEKSINDKFSTLKGDLTIIQPYPDYVDVIIEEGNKI